MTNTDKLLQSAYDVMEQAIDDMSDGYSVCPAVKLWMLKWMDESGIKCESGHAPDIEDLLKYDSKELARVKAENARLRDVVEWLAMNHEVRTQRNSEAVYWAGQFRVAHEKAKQALQQKGE